MNDYIENTNGFFLLHNTESQKNECFAFLLDERLKTNAIKHKLHNFLIKSTYRLIK